MTRQFEHVLDLGSHDGTLAAMLADHPQTGAVEAGEMSSGLRALGAERGLDIREMNEEALGVDEAAYDLVTSVLSLHWVNDLPGALIQIRRALPGRSGLGWFSAGAQPDSQTTLNVARKRPSGSANRSA